MNIDETLKEVKRQWTIKAVEDNPVKAWGTIQILVTLAEEMRKDAPPTSYSNWLSEKRGW
jgi:hypothetical protein